MYLLYVSYANEHTRVTWPNIDYFFIFKNGFFEKWNLGFSNSVVKKSSSHALFYKSRKKSEKTRIHQRSRYPKILKILKIPKMILISAKILKNPKNSRKSWRSQKIPWIAKISKNPKNTNYPKMQNFQKITKPGHLF